MAASMFGCSTGAAKCGPGTMEVGDQCLPDDATASGGAGSTGSSASASTGSGGAGGCAGDTTGPCAPLDKAAYQTEPGYFDVVLDTERHQVFLSYGTSGTVHVIGLKDGSDKVVTTGWSAEHMHFDPILDQVVISLPASTHSAFWWTEDQVGYVAAIDAVTLVDPEPIWIPLDPWQIVADGTGRAYAAGGSGQWTSAVTVDLSTHWSKLSTEIVRQGTNIRLHPAKDRIYGTDTDVSPNERVRWDIVSGEVQPAAQSPHYGDGYMCGDLRIHPSGSTIYTKCGEILLASNVSTKDMTSVGSLDLAWDDLAFHPANGQVYVLKDNAPTVFVYDSTTLMPSTTHPLSAPAQRILAGPTYLVVIRDVLGGSPKTEVEVIPYADL